ncbi:MAG: hypothetical protein JXN59_02720, partial [Anaerolineae bacterium]|nr:hypothetical protein [Anaerolineae bacterium]
LINPALWLDRIAPAVHAEMIFVSVVIIAVVYALVLIVSQSPGAISSRECLAADRQLLWRGVGFGLALALFTILGVAPTNWNLAANPRLVYAAGAGTAFAGIAGLAWIGSRLPRYVALVIFIIPAILIGLGAGLGVQQHTQRLACQANRQRVMDAIHEVLPGFSEHAQPYILLVSDAHPQRDLCLNPQDINFPYMFALLYGFTPTENDAIYADALLFDVHATERPSPGTPGITYTGQYIVVDAEGIYSPLRPGVAIDPASLIIVSYDSNTDSAAIMEYLSNDVIEQANIEVRAPIVWKTNFNLIAN